MVRLLAFECKKHFLKKSVLIALLVFSAINVVKIHGVYENESALADVPSWKQAYRQVYGNFSGEMSADKIDKLLGMFRPLEQAVSDMTATTAFDVPGTLTGNLYSDYHLLDWYYVQPMEYVYMYRNTASNIAAQARDNMAFYQDLGNQYEYRRNAAIADRFEGRTISGFYYTEMYQYLVQYDFSVLLVLLLCIFGIASVFAAEKETEMELILLTTRNGGYRTIFAKIIASMMFVTAVCVWFWLLDFAAFSAFFSSTEGAGTPIFALRDFANSPISISLGAYALLSGASKAMGVAALCMCFLFVANLFRNALLPFIVNAIAVIGFILFEEMFLGSSQIFLKAINPFALIMNRDLFHKTEFVNMLGFPVVSYLLAYIIGTLWIAVFGALLIGFSRKNTVCGKGRLNEYSAL